MKVPPPRPGKLGTLTLLRETTVEIHNPLTDYCFSTSTFSRHGVKKRSMAA